MSARNSRKKSAKWCIKNIRTTNLPEIGKNQFLLSLLGERKKKRLWKGHLIVDLNLLLKRVEVEAARENRKRRGRIWVALQMRNLLVTWDDRLVRKDVLLLLNGIQMILYQQLLMTIKVHQVPVRDVTLERRVEVPRKRDIAADTHHHLVMTAKTRKDLNQMKSLFQVTQESKKMLIMENKKMSKH